MRVFKDNNFYLIIFFDLHIVAFALTKLKNTHFYYIIKF